MASAPEGALGLRSRIDALCVALNRACQAEGIDVTAPASTRDDAGQGDAELRLVALAEGDGGARRFW
jgi:hypothetical protein